MHNDVYLWAFLCKEVTSLCGTYVCYFWPVGWSVICTDGSHTSVWSLSTVFTQTEATP